MSCSRTQHSTTSGNRNLEPDAVPLHHCATLVHFCNMVTAYPQNSDLGMQCPGIVLGLGTGWPVVGMVYGCL